MRLSARLSAFFLAALATVLAGFSAALFASAWFYLHRQLDDRLDAALAVLAAAAEIHPDAVEWEPNQRELPLGRDTGGDGLRWFIFDEAGRAVDRSGNIADTGPAPDVAFRSGGSSPPRRLTDGRGRPWRIGLRRVNPPGLAGPVAAKSRRGWHRSLELVVAVPVGPVEAALAALGWSLAGLSTGIWLVAAALGRGLVRRALAPLGRMVESARALDAADPGWTLPEAGTADELDELGRAFNDLLARLRIAYEQQRRFSGDASHQLRTPLTALVGQIDVALRRERSPEEYRRVLGLVRGQAGNLARIVEALLFLGRADAEAGLPDTEALDLAAWTTAHVAAHPRAGSIRLDLVDGPLVVRAHPALLGELVDNLLDNAAKYGEPGAPIVVRLVDEGEHASLSIEDRGPGIDPADLPRVFEPFFRSDRARRLGKPGVGLGLAVTKRIAVALGGTISVASEPGRGCRFTVSLPTSRDAEWASGGMSPAPDPAAGGNDPALAATEAGQTVPDC